MNHDEVMWNVMGQGFCSFKVMTRDDKVRFCRNPYNVTGLCSRATCPLSNAQYATVVEHEDELYLYVKTAERAHLPRRQWEKTKLDASFPKALEQIDEQLQWWDRRHVNKVKARLLRLKQYLMRKRKMMMEPQDEFVSVNKRQEHKLLRREAKAEAAARIELEIERELLDRLKKGAYDSIVNYDQKVFDKMLDDEELQDEQVEEEEDDLEDYDDGMVYSDEEQELEMESKPKKLTQYVMDDDDDEDDDAFGDVAKAKPSSKKSSARSSSSKPKGAGGSGSTEGKKRGRITIERELEQERRAQPRVVEDW